MTLASAALLQACAAQQPPPEPITIAIGLGPAGSCLLEVDGQQLNDDQLGERLRHRRRDKAVSHRADLGCSLPLCRVSYLLAAKRPCAVQASVHRGATAGWSRRTIGLNAPRLGASQTERFQETAAPAANVTLWWKADIAPVLENDKLITALDVPGFIGSSSG